MKNKKLEKFLIKHNACSDGFDFAKNLTLKQFLNSCERGDWILWLFKKMNPDSLTELTLAKALCANTVRHLMKDARSIKAIDTAIAFGENRATKQELDAAYAAAGAAAGAYAAADAAADAAYAAYAAAGAAAGAYAAAYAAADAAYAAYAAAGAGADAAGAAADAADAAAAAAYAAADAAYAAADAAYAGAKKQNQKITANICRKYLPLEIWDQSKL